MHHQPCSQHLQRDLQAFRCGLPALTQRRTTLIQLEVIVASLLTLSAVQLRSRSAFHRVTVCSLRATGLSLRACSAGARGVRRAAPGTGSGRGGSGPRGAGCGGGRCRCAPSLRSELPCLAALPLCTGAAQQRSMHIQRRHGASHKLTASGHISGHTWQQNLVNVMHWSLAPTATGACRPPWHLAPECFRAAATALSACFCAVLAPERAVITNPAGRSSSASPSSSPSPSPSPSPRNANQDILNLVLLLLLPRCPRQRCVCIDQQPAV